MKEKEREATGRNGREDRKGEKEKKAGRQKCWKGGRGRGEGLDNQDSTWHQRPSPTGSKQEEAVCVLCGLGGRRWAGAQEPGMEAQENKEKKRRWMGAEDRVPGLAASQPGLLFAMGENLASLGVGAALHRSCHTVIPLIFL